MHWSISWIIPLSHLLIPTNIRSTYSIRVQLARSETNYGEMWYGCIYCMTVLFSDIKGIKGEKKLFNFRIIIDNNDGLNDIYHGEDGNFDDNDENNYKTVWK